MALLAEKISDYKYKTPIAIRFSDIDAVGHVNNAIYLTYFEMARFSYWRDVTDWNFSENGIIVGRAEVQYLKPVMLHDKISCGVRIVRIGNSSFDVMHILIRSTAIGEEIVTVGKTVCVSYDYSVNKPVRIPPHARDKMIAYDEPRLILNTN